MEFHECLDLAEKIREEYNPDGLSPFPYQNIEQDKKDLSVIFTEMPDKISGAITYDKSIEQFIILINKKKQPTRQNFTIAHELGHYFLHSEIIKSDETFVDNDDTLEGRMLFLLDEEKSTIIETQANKFAASLIMPEKQVMKVWDTFKDIAECANIFNVPILTMTIRLTSLDLVNE